MSAFSMFQTIQRIFFLLYAYVYTEHNVYVFSYLTFWKQIAEIMIHHF